MSFFRGKAKFSFLYSETPAGANCAADDDSEHTVEFTFEGEEWSEHHPYGSTTAEERLSEVDDTSYHYRLDGEPVELEAMRQRFGAEWMAARLEAAESKADISSYDKGGNDYDGE